MKKIINILTLAVVLLAASLPAFSQASTQPTFTTLSAAMADERTTRMTVTSATGFTASTGSLDYFVFIDREFMKITAVSGTTITVSRGQAQTSATTHKSGAYAFVGTAASSAGPATGQTSGGPFIQTPMYGACTFSLYPILPLIQVNASARGGQAMYNCNNGTWVQQTLINDVDTGITRFCAPNFVGALALLTSFGDALAPFNVGANTTPVAGRWQYGSIWIPQTTLLTGGSVLNGAVAGTDLVLYALLRADGVTQRNTAIAGTTASGVRAFQDIAWTSTFLATGPARYWIAWQANGTTTRLATVPLTPGATTAGLGAFIGMLGSWFEGTALTVPVNFASLPSGTAKGANTIVTSLPTSLITGSAPISCVY